MATQHQANFEKLFEIKIPIYCPVEDNRGTLYIVSTTGEIYEINEGTPKPSFATGGSPVSLLFDSEGSAFIADLAYHAILSKTPIDEKNCEITPVIKDYDG